MGNAVKMYALELNELSGRAFILSDHDLTGAQRYSGVMFFQSAAEATKEMKDEVDHGLEEDQIHVAPVYLHADGKLVDSAGFEITHFVSRQTGQSEAEVKSNISAYHKFESERLAKSLGR